MKCSASLIWRKNLTMRTSSLENLFLLITKTIPGFPKPIREYKFLKDRRFRFDFAWKKQKIAVEIEGGIWIHGAHVRSKHFISDCDKYNLAVLNGWRVFRFTGEHLEDAV